MQVRIFTRLLALRYSGFCNVLHTWSVWAIPTYRVYQLYDSNYIGRPKIMHIIQLIDYTV